MNECDKIGYDSYEEAHKAQRGLAARKRGSTRLYACENCGKLHITTLPSGNRLKKHRNGKRNK